MNCSGSPSSAPRLPRQLSRSRPRWEWSRPGPRPSFSNLADLQRATSPANVNHYNVQPVYDVFANVQGRDLAAVARDGRQVAALDIGKDVIDRLHVVVVHVRGRGGALKVRQVAETGARARPRPFPSWSRPAELAWK